LDHLYRVCESFGEAIRTKNAPHDIVIRSTVLPGTAEDCTSLVEQVSGLKAGDGFHLVINPEFLSEGTALADYRKPQFPGCGSRAGAAARGLHPSSVS